MSVLLEALARSRQVQQVQQADVVADASGSVDSAAAGLTLSDGGNLALAPEALPPQSESQPDEPATRRSTDPAQASARVRALKEAALAPGFVPDEADHKHATPGPTRSGPSPASSARRRQFVVLGGAATTLLIAGLIGAYLWTLSGPGPAGDMPAQVNPMGPPAGHGQSAAPAAHQAEGVQAALRHEPAAASTKLANGATEQPGAAGRAPAKAVQRAPVPPSPPIRETAVAAELGEASPAVHGRSAPANKTAAIGASASALAPVALATGPKDTEDRLRQAYSSLAAGDLAGARPAYEAILKDSPRELDALLGLAFIEQTRGRPAAARSLYQRALELQPGQIDAQLGFLSSTAELGLDDPAVLALAREVAQSRPESAAAQFAAGQLLAQKGDLSSATELLGRAASLQPTNALYLFNWAVALDRLGRRPQALQVYRQVLQGVGIDDSGGVTAQGVNRDTVRQRIEALQAALPATDLARP